MIQQDHRYGPFVGRVWGLIVNLLANALALYGLVGYLRDGDHLMHLTVGLGVTAACTLWLAKPSP